MSILKAMNIGLSGLNANGLSMGVIGDNIANVNTAGYKSSRAEFADILARTTLGIGDGVGVTSVQQDFGQGTVEMTGNALDLAISGEGFMILNGTVNGVEGDFYTRAGQFVVDNEGYIASSSGLRLQGYGVDSDGNIAGTPGDLLVAGSTAPPSPTSEITTALNLDPNSEIIAGGFDITDPGASSNYSSSVTVYDSLGNEIPVDIYYTKTAAGTFEYNAVVDGAYLNGGTPGTPQVVDTGAITFDTDGNMTSAMPPAFTLDPLGATTPQSIQLDFDGSTMYAGENTVRSLAQDGFAAGELAGIDISPDGTISGVFSNGETLTLGQVALADFTAPQGLERQGGNLWAATRESGEALVGAAGSGGKGTMVAGAIEGSNVDLAHEFVKMIAVQRGFQANSKIITTGDSMLTEIVNLKR